MPKLRDPRGPIVQQVRDAFLEREYKPAPEQFYEQDVELIRRMDFLLQRCVIMQRKDVEASAKMAGQVLRWRKQRRVYDVRDSDFPQELTLVGAAFVYDDDKFANRTLYLRAAMCKNCAELKAAMKDFLTHLMFTIDDARAGATYTLIMDLTNAGLANYDMDLLTHIVTLLKDYFPVNLDYLLAVNFPWVLSAAWALIKRLIPAERRDAVRFIKSDEIFEYVAREHCPDFLGGSCARPYSYVAAGAPTAVEYIVRESAAPPTKRRLREILRQFSDALPAPHVAKLAAQIDQLNEPASGGPAEHVAPKSAGQLHGAGPAADRKCGQRAK